MANVTLTPDEIVARGRRYYEEHLRDQLEPDHVGEYVVIDIDTGDYELDADERLAFLRAREARPDGIVCILRVGYRAAGRLGRSRCEPLKA